MSGINWYATLDNKEFLAKLQQCADKVKGTSSTIKKEGTAIDSVFKKLAQAAASFGAALSVKELISSLVKVRGEFQSLETAFRVMLGNAEQANALMAQLTKTAATTPFSLTDVTSAAKQLLAYGVAADSVNETLIKLGDISAGLAIPLGDLTYLYGTTMAQGRLYTQDLNQFTNRGIPMIGELAKQFGVATGEVKKLVEEGRVGFPQVEAAINSLTGEGSKFGGLMAEQVKGINGLISNLGDAVDRMFDAIGKSNQDAIEGVLKGAINIVDNYEKVGRVLAEIVAVWGTYKAACIAAHLAMYKHTALLRTLLTVFPKLAAAQKALNAAMLSNPYVLAATALSALIVAMVNATDATKGLEKAQEEYQARIERLEEKEDEHRRSVEKLIGVAEDERLSTEERLSALEKLEGWYPTIFGKYQTEYDMLSNILAIKRQIAAQDAANSISEPKNRLKMVEDTIAKLEKKSQDYIARMKDELGDAYTGTSPWASDGLSTAERAQLEMLKNTRAELKTEVSKAEAEAYFSNLAGISNEQLEAMIKERETLLAKIAIGETSDAKRHVGRTTTGYKGVYTADELQEQLNRLEAEQSRRNEPLTTNTERLARAQRAYLDAQQAYTDFLSDSSTQMTDVDAAKRAEELKSKVKAAKAELERWGGAIEKTTAAAEAGELSVAVSVDTKEAQDALVEYQAALKALEDYRASARVTVEADTEKASAALSNLSKEGDDAIKAEIAQYNERLEGNEAYQRRKLAIAEKYAGLITKAETPEQKTELEQQRTAAMQAARAEASETDSVLRGSFDAIVANIKEQLGTLFGELTSYTAEAEGGAPLSDWQKSFNDAVTSMQEAAESGLRDTLDITPLREHLGEVESILGDTQIEPIVGEGEVTLDASDVIEGIKAIDAELAALAGDTVVSVRAALDSSALDEADTFKIDAQVEDGVEGIGEIKDAYNELKDTVGESVVLGQVNADSELKRLEDAVVAAKAKYESLVGVTEAGEDALVDLRARNRQKEIELIENSFEQRLATINAEYDAELSELDKQQASLEAVNGGVLTQGMVDELEKARSLADDVRKKALEDAINDEIASFNARVDESETYQRRRLAIAEKYAALIAAAEEPEQKTELEQRKTTELKAARVNEAIADIDWQSVFGKTSRLFEEQINATLEQLREYAASDEYNALQPSERKTVTEAIDRLETMTVSGQGTLSFRDLREQADRVGQAFSDVVTARNEEAAAYDELLAAQQEYAAALETGDQSRIEPAQTKVEETKVAADTSTARYLSAKDNLNELSQSYGDALSDTRDGLEELAAGLRQLSGSSLSSVYNGLQTFVDGLNKLQVGDGEGILSKMFGKMTSLPIGEVISIADVFSEGISPILTNIVDSLFSSVTNILDDILSLDIVTDLFSSIGNGLASLGDTLTFGLFSGLRNSNAKEVRELTETLTESNEQLTNSIDKLCEEIESEGGVTAVETAEQAIENMEQVIEQTMDVLESNMSYHNHHHSNASYWGLTEEDYASLNETLADYALKYGEGAEASVVNSLEDIYGLTPEEMDYIRTWNTTMWNEMLEQGKYDMSEYWEAYADLAGEIEEIENSLKETLTQTTFDTLRDNFLDALTDMETEAEDFSEDFEDMLRTAVVNSMLSELFDDEIQAFYDSFAELFENGTDAITESDIEALNDQWDTLVDEMLEMRDYYFEALGLTDDSTSEAAQASSALTVEASQESVDEANGRLTAMTALQSQTLTQLQSMQEASTTLSNKQYTLTAEIRQALVTANGHLEDIYERLKVKGNEIVAGLEDIHNALT